MEQEGRNVEVPRGRLDAVLQIAESGLTLEHVATFPVSTGNPSSSCADVAGFMRDEGFDVVVLDEEGERYRYVEVVDIEGRTGTVGDHARMIDTRHLLPASLSLAEGLEALRRQPFFFLLRGRSIEGIFTRADIQRPAVSMLTFGFILAAEAGINELISSRCGDAWPEMLSEARLATVEAILQERRRYNAELTLLDCLMLEDRLRVAQKSDEVRGKLGFASGKQVRAWGQALKPLRDTLAHGGSLLDHAPDPDSALELVHDVRAAAHRVWDAVADRKT
jgi:hypothetical protein